MFTESTQWSQITEALAYILVFYVNMLKIASKENKQYYNYVSAIVISNLLCIILMLHDVLINKNTFQCYFILFFAVPLLLLQHVPIFFLLRIKLLTFCFICVCLRERLYLSMGLKGV